MAEIQKFLFDRRFDGGGSRKDSTGRSRAELEAEAEAALAANEPEQPEEPPPPPPPMYTAAQLEAAREEGYIAGHTAALDEASQASERMTALALQEVAHRLDGLQARHDVALDAISRDGARMILAVCRKVLPASAEQGAQEEVIHLVAELLPDVLDAPRLTVRVNPTLADTLRDRLGETVENSGYEGKLIVQGDDRVPPSDCRVDWGEGGVDRDVRRTWEEIETLIDRHLDVPGSEQS